MSILTTSSTLHKIVKIITYNKYYFTLFSLLMSEFSAGSQSDSGLLKGLLTDNFCHVCEATLLYESQRVSHYEVCEVVFRATVSSFFRQPQKAAVIFLTLVSMLPGEKACTKSQDVLAEQEH